MRPRTLFIGSEIYRNSRYANRHPLAIPRVSTVIDLARALHWLPAEVYRDSPVATVDELCAFHDPGYVAAVQRAEGQQKADPELLERYNIGRLENPVFGEVFRRPATAAGASLLAADLIVSGEADRIYSPQAVPITVARTGRAGSAISMIRFSVSAGCRPVVSAASPTSIWTPITAMASRMQPAMIRAC